MMGRIFALVGGLLFAGSLAYFLVAYLRFGDPAPSAGLTTGPAAAIDVLLFTVFALHHSAFARTGLKAAVSARVSTALERSVYVWVASLLFIGTLWFWIPVPGLAWSVTAPGAWLLYAGWAAGLGLTALGAAKLDPLELAGVRQAFDRPSPADRSLTTNGVYGWVRHPIYLGWILLVWSVPVMTGTRLVFATVSTAYLIVAIPLEERQMHRTLGARYEAYAKAVRWRILPGLY